MLATPIHCCVYLCPSGPVLALVLAKKDAVSHWKQLVGPARRDQDPTRY